MCSPRWPDLLGRDAAAAMLDAVTAVAGQSFFAVVEPCDAGRFAALSAQTARWIVAAVTFTEIDGEGSVSCTLSEDLAHALFDAFSGREPWTSAPPADEVRDLLGEFANMVCGTWLTRLATNQTFTLQPPSVCPAPDASQRTEPGARLLLVVNDLPLAVDVRVAERVNAGA